MKLIGYLAAAVNLVSFVGPSSKIKISLFLLSIYTDELISALKKMIFFRKLPPINKNSTKIRSYAVSAILLFF